MVPVADSDPMARPDQALEIREVYEWIAELPENFRFALVAVDVLGLSYREAARALRIREATLTSRLHRARSQVSRHIAAEPSADRPERASRERGRQDAAGRSRARRGLSGWRAEMTARRPETETELVEMLRASDVRAPQELHRRVEAMVAERSPRRRRPAGTRSRRARS